MDRKRLSMLFVFVLSACSRGNAPFPAGVVGPEIASDLSESGVGVHTAAIVPGNCTFSQGFWKNHESDWPVEELILGGVTVSKVNALALLRTPPRGDATIILVHQLIAAKLNVANGADPSAVASTLTAADAFLAANPIGSKPGGAAKAAGTALASVLDDYNNGGIGPGHCGDATPTPVTPTPTATATPTATPTETPEPTPPPV